MPYPNQLAAGVTAVSAFVPFELWAGESDIVTDQGTCGSTALSQFQVIARDNDGTIVPWEPSTASNVGTLYASGTLTMGGQPTAADTVTIGSNVVTFVASGATGAQVNIGASAAATSANLLAYIQANDVALGVEAAATSATVIRLTAIVEGTAGNSIALAKSGTYPAVSASTLTGGVSVTTGADKAIGFTAQAAAAGGPVPFYKGGSPNHLALVWPASVTSLSQRKAAFDGTAITISSLL